MNRCSRRREQLPQNRQSGPITDQWFNSVGRALQRTSFGVPGSTMDGIRSSHFQSDMPFPKRINWRFVVTDYRVEDPLPAGVAPKLTDIFTHGANSLFYTEVEEQLRVFTQNTADGSTGLGDEDVYECMALALGRSPDANFVAPPGEITEEVTPKRIITEFPGEFFMVRDPASTKGIFPPDGYLGDFVEAYYDYMVNRFIAFQGPTIRAGVVIDRPDNAPGVFFQKTIFDGVTVQIYQETLLGTLTPTHTVVIGVRTNWVRNIPSVGDHVFMELIQGIWHLTAINPRAHDVYFVLDEDLSVTTPLAIATIRRFAHGQHPGIAIGATIVGFVGQSEKILVYNDEAGCGRPDYRYAASAGCNGIARWDDIRQRYWIWQIDCDPDPPDERSVSSASSSSSST